MPLTESDRITITRQPPLPSRCCICNFSADGTRRFLDFEMSLDIYGAVVICEACVAPVAQLFGYVLSTELNSANVVIDILENKIAELQDNNERLNATLDSILHLRPDLGSSGISSAEVSDSVTVSDDFEFGIELDSEGSDDREVDESATERGLEDISFDGDDEHSD